MKNGMGIIGCEKYDGCPQCLFEGKFHEPKPEHIEYLYPCSECDLGQYFVHKNRRGEVLA